MYSNRKGAWLGGPASLVLSRAFEWTSWVLQSRETFHSPLLLPPDRRRGTSFVAQSFVTVKCLNALGSVLQKDSHC